MIWAVLGALAGAVQLSLGLVFALSVVTKLRHPWSFARSVEEYRLLPRQVSRAAAIPLIVVELALALALLAGTLIGLALPLALVTLAVFLVAVAVNLRRGRRVACGCFGNAGERISGRTVARLVLLTAAVASLLVLRAGGHGRDAGLSALAAVPLTDLLPTWLLAVALLLLASWTLRLPDIVAMTRTQEVAR